VHVTVTTTRGTPDQPMSLATMAGEEMFPWLSEIDGFKGLLMLSNDEDATTLVLTFWESREVADAHRAARAEFRKRMTDAVDVRVEATTDYVVSFADVDALKS